MFETLNNLKGALDRLQDVCFARHKEDSFQSEGEDLHLANFFLCINKLAQQNDLKHNLIQFNFVYTCRTLPPF